MYVLQLISHGVVPTLLCLYIGLSHTLGLYGQNCTRILEQEEAICHVLSMDRKSTSLNLTWQDKDVLQSMNQVLSKLSELTDILSGENYVTVSSVLRMVELLNNTLLK